jgi:hypothetical protein
MTTVAAGSIGAMPSREVHAASDKRTVATAVLDHTFMAGLLYHARRHAGLQVALENAWPAEERDCFDDAGPLL